MSEAIETRTVRAGNPEVLERVLAFHRADGFEVIQTVQDREGVYVSRLEKRPSRPEVKTDQTSPRRRRKE